MKEDNPRIYIPPPFIYLFIFLIAWWVQTLFPFSKIFLQSIFIKITGGILITASAFFGLSAVRIFFLSRNTVETFKAATSLQTKGIYTISRNPMYVGLSFAYLGFSCFFGNAWCFILFPACILIMQFYVIRREEKYLERRFGEQYLNYKKKVRRWL